MRTWTFAAATLTLALVFAGCHELDAGPGEDDGMSPVQSRELDRGQYSGQEEAARLVVDDAGDWADLWEEHMRHTTAESGPPEVDFSRERVIAVFMGARPNGCYHIAVTDVNRDAEGRTVVDVTSSRPGPEAVCTQAFVQPFHFVAVPDDSSEVVFQEHETVVGEGGG